MDMLETRQFVRKTFLIQEVQVTAQNMEMVAKWVGGEVCSDALGQHVKVKVHRPLNDRQTKAYATDHVLFAGTGFKVYNDRAFKKSFDLASEETVMVDTSKPKKSEAQSSEIVGVVEGDVVVPKRVAKKAAKRTPAVPYSEADLAAGKPDPVPAGSGG